MSLSSHVTANLDQWVENGFINIQQREAIAQLIEGACYDANDAGYSEGYSDGLAEAKPQYSDAYDDGYDAGFADGQATGGN